jgi:hypothetical protein
LNAPLVYSREFLDNLFSLTGSLSKADPKKPL